MIDLDSVATFLAVAEAGGFREAAKASGLSQSTVTQHVKRLERSLHTVLIERSHAGCTLTPHGAQFLPYAQQLLRTARRARALFDPDLLSVGASSNIGIYLLPPYLKAWRDQSTDRLDVAIGKNTEIVDKLENFEIDVAVMEWWDGRPGFTAQLWRREALSVIVPPDHPWAERASIPAPWLHGQTLLGGESGTGTGRLLQQAFGADAKSLQTGMQLGSTEAVKRAVHAGLGISLVMTCSVAQERRDGRLAVLAIEGIAPVKELFVVTRSNLAPQAPARRFAGMLLADRAQPLTEALVSEAV